MPAQLFATSAHRPPKFVIPFAAIDDTLRERVGGKAYSLGVLLAAGFPVPDGFALTTEALARHLEVNELGLSARAAEADGGEAALAAFRDRVVAAPLPPDVRAALQGEFRVRFSPATPLAVRSSGTREDLEGASFAGQYETILNVRGEAALEEAVKRCWASLWRPRVLEYARARAGGATGLSMSVAVQRLIEPDVAGVLFTVNPLTGREHEILVEATFGLGEALVSGRVNADRFVVDAATGRVLSRHIAEKRIRVVSAPDGGTAEIELSSEEARRPTLDEPQLAKLAELGAAIQEHYGRPMDVEWVLSQGELYVVQARPVTKLSFADDLGEWTTADFKDGGVASDVCSPFMWSLYELALEDSFPKYFRSIKLLRDDAPIKWSRMFFARPYWNLGVVKKILAQIPGYKERNFDLDLGITPTYEGPGVTTPTTLAGIARALPVLFALKRSYREVLEKDRRFVERFAERKAPYDLDPATLPREEFVRRYRSLITDLYFETETTYFTTIYNTSNSKLDFKVHFERANAACGGTLDLLKLMGGLEDLSHMRPMRDLHALLARLRAEGRGVTDEAVREFATRWRHHGRKELDIRVPRWIDDLPFVRQMLEQGLAAYDPSQPGPDEQARAQKQAYLAERARAERALRFRPFARRAFVRGLELVRTYAWWREEMRDHSSYLYYLVRAWSVDAARRLVAEGVLTEADDVWYLPYQDVLATLEGTLAPDEARRRVRAGRRMVRSFRNFQNPNEIGNRYTQAPLPPPGVLRGTACAPGRVEARARVVRRVEDVGRVGPGEVLVTVFTDPGWTPVFARIAGVVTETGGVLAHAAVIAREYGIPAVLAVSGATQRIPDGALVVVDGNQGTVEVKE